MYYYTENRSAAKLPIVLIPGLFGSLGDDILPGTGDLNFGMAEHVYRPIIEDLEELGYKEGKDLFIAFYDWRKGCEYNTEKYLIPKIEEAKRATMRAKVDLIGHSLGGIVARTYIQGSLYNKDVRNLIMMGTPNSGAVNAYYFWSGGQMPYDKLEKNVIYQLLKIGFFWIYRFLHGPISDVNILRRLFPVAEELLPSYGYGNYLFYDDNGGIKKPVPITQMESVNRHLNKMNKTSHLIFNRGVIPYHIIGTGLETTDIICVNKNNRSMDKWFDGKPMYSISMPYGDGTITISSAEAIYSKNYYLSSNHGDILKKSKDILASILMRPSSPQKDYRKEAEQSYVYSIILRNVPEAEIHYANTEKVLNIAENTTTRDYITRKMGDNLHWIVLSSKEKEKIKLNFNPKKEQDYEMLVFFAERNGEIEMIRKSFKSRNTTISLFGANCL
ncbi:hypothetical protein [Proteiniborus sp. MB09-C3]|uniref:lipase family alpha/beta hydrolase n=1 Tax=Proteiniborus sp. MB09-C3 TaxID=3050072 RepID=UPI0025575A4A|nr:hypothetical protein [Proteiniborus sp. MB09-C3]WIV13872.1 hypothetical protein QO263_09305 [Proteiniborus sp. MB09-C3]